MNKSIIPTGIGSDSVGAAAPQDANPCGACVSDENANAKESETISYMKKYQESAFSIRLGLKFSSQ